MALLSGLTGLVKGTPGAITLDKATLFALPSVVADSWFSVQANVEVVKVVYVSAAGQQIKTLMFKVSDEIPLSYIYFSPRARDSFVIQKIILVDHETDLFEIPATEIPTGLGINFEGPAAPSTVILSGASGPVGIAEDSAGNIYCSDWYLGTMRKYDSSGALVATFGSGQFRSVVTDANDNIYIMEWNSGTISKYDTAGNLLQSFYPGMGDGYAHGIASNGHIYAAMGQNHCIVHLDSVGNIINTIQIGHHVAQIAVSATKVFFAGDGLFGMMDLDGSNVTTISSYNVAGLAVDAQGYIYMGSMSLGTSSPVMVKWNPDATNPAIVDANVTVGWVYGYGKKTHTIYSSAGGATDTLTRWSAN